MKIYEVENNVYVKFIKEICLIFKICEFFLKIIEIKGCFVFVEWVEGDGLNKKYGNELVGIFE